MPQRISILVGVGKHLVIPVAALNTKHKSCCFDSQIDRRAVRMLPDSDSDSDSDIDIDSDFYASVSVAISNAPVRTGHTQIEREGERIKEREKRSKIEEAARLDACLSVCLSVCLCPCLTLLPLTLTETNHCCANKKSMHCPVLPMSCCAVLVLVLILGLRHVLPSCPESFLAFLMSPVPCGDLLRRCCSCRCSCCCSCKVSCFNSSLF